MYGTEDLGYARLWATVLHLSVNDIRLYARKHEVDMDDVEAIGGRDARGAAAWIMSDETRGGGFLWVCDLLEINPEFARSKVLDGGMRRTLSPEKQAQRAKDAAKRARKKC